MNSSSKPAAHDSLASAEASGATDRTAARARRREHLRWWIKLCVQPILFLLFGTMLIIGLGVAQKVGWISAGGASINPNESAGADEVRYICPMMCTPPQAEAGRCPVCAMELVPAASGGGSADSESIQLDPAARRVANVRTVAASAVHLSRTIRAVGELNFDEGCVKTISAYVDGRLDRLYADYNGVVVRKADHLALLYSPRLYSGQVELLLAKKAQLQSRSATLHRVFESNRDLYESAKQRLIELGMTESQIDGLEQAGEASSRMHLCAPISGTVIEKYAVEGQYVKEGQAIYRLADLSSLWLMLELFPEDAAAIRYGQRVEARVQSLPNRIFTGRVAFIDPTVDRMKRTVGVRVVIANDDGILRVGDYARATIEMPLAGPGGARTHVYDPELAGKWISPRHPHVVESSPGTCRVCGVALEPASQLGFADEPVSVGQTLVVPRSAVLMAGGNSVVYVESEPGRFEIRPVVLGPSSGDQIVIVEGVSEGEQVAVSGNFLIDSQMQLAGNPSLIDPTRASPTTGIDVDESKSVELIAALSKLSAEDRALAERQRICPVAGYPLGSMGTPPKVDVNGTPVFICCEGCRESLLNDSETYLAKLDAQAIARDDDKELPRTDIPPIGEMEMLSPHTDPTQMTFPHAASDTAARIAEALARLPPPDRRLAQKQKTCPVADTPLGSMGTPIKVDVNGRSVFICCEGCRESLLAEPVKYVAKLSQEVSR